MVMNKQQHENVDKLIKIMNKSLDDNGRYCCYWGAVTDTGQTYVDPNTSCHAGLGSYGVYAPKDIEFVASRINRESNTRPLYDEVMEEWLKWFTLKSPYRKAIVTKGGKANLKRGYIVFSPKNVPMQIFVGAIIAARCLTEFYGSIAFVWYGLVKHGVDPNVAFCYAHTVRCLDQENIQPTYTIDGHAALCGSQITGRTVENFRKGEWDQRLTKKWEYPYKYNGINNAFTYGDYNALPVYADRQEIAELAKRVEGVKVKVNPFPKKGQRIDQREIVPFDKFLSIYAERINQAYGDNNE